MSSDDSLFRKIVFVSVILVLASVGSAGAVSVNTCQVISSPGVYTLTQDLSSSVTCITIESSDVTFDGQGYTIDGTKKPGTYGIYVYKSATTLTNVTVNDTVATNWHNGIIYDNVENGAITNNIVSSNNYSGIYLYKSSNNLIEDNTASGNNREGIAIDFNSNDNTITGNTVTGNSASTKCFISRQLTNDSYGGIAIYESDSNIVSYNTVSDDGCDGIALYKASSKNTITGNNVDNNDFGGIVLDTSSDNTIEGNAISSNKEDGIALYKSNSNSITGNTASNSKTYGGIYLEASSNNDIIGNTFSNNKWEGISLNSSSSSNTIKDNTASGNGKYGIYLKSSSGNTIYNNNLNNNDVNDASDDGSNTWNTSKTSGTNIIGGSFLGGNYYSDYTGSDSDSDGIGDSSYNIPGGSSIDYLPLVKASGNGGGNGGGSSGGGGGGGGGAATSFETYIKNVLLGQTYELDIDDEDIPYINGLSLTAKQDIYSSKLSITDLDKKPWYGMEDPNASVYRYFKVSYDKDNSVESAGFRFSINKSWLEENNIDPYKFSIYRYTNSWKKLDTKILKQDNKKIYFKAATPGFSYFSLGGENDSGYRQVEEDEETPTVTTTTTLKATTTTTPAVTPTPRRTSLPPDTTKPPAKEDKGGICGPTAVILISMLSLLVFRGIRSKR